ncbi:hypothetical protein KP509_10G081700 [Ceratopteris richardii]|uniref:BHLH domain-containing protein n=1 Tax=Ceratopteris richardii TaxID=49495 RepID=A0A8T2TZ32_CERRI|nr:hypothetical protein KP509_10G081700 [Ceratopteris richardii]
MDYSTEFAPHTVQGHVDIQDSSLTYSMPMKDSLFSCSHSPEAPYAAFSYNVNKGSFKAHEQGSFYCNPTYGVDGVSETQHVSPSTSCMYALPENTAIPSSPLWLPEASAPYSLFSSAVSDQTLQYLCNLQNLLRSQYGIAVSVDELLAFDALPSLLQQETDHPPYSRLDAVKHEPHLDYQVNGAEDQDCLGHYSYCQNTANLTNEVIGQEYSMHSNGQVLETSPTPGCNRLPFVSESVTCIKRQELGSPGSAASSSIVTDSENAAQPEHHVPSAGSFTIDNIQSWAHSVASWLIRGEDDSHALRESNTMAPLENEEPPSQRRKLQGITLEQVLQAEKLHQANSATWTQPFYTYTPTLPSQIPLIQQPCNNTTSATAKDVVGGLESGSVGNGERHDMSQALVHAKKPPSAVSVEPQSIAARHRRKRIRDKTLTLATIVPGASRLDTAAMFDLAIKYVQFLQAQMWCLEKEMSFSCNYQRLTVHEDENFSAFRRALINRLLSSQDVQHFLSREGLCLVTENLAKSLSFDPKSVHGRK